MSGIEKTSDGVRKHSPTGHIKAPQTRPVQPNETFNPTKVMIDRQIVRDHVEDPFTAAIREAQDGDSDEAIARRTSLGPDDADRSTPRTVLDRVRKSRTANPQDQSEPDQSEPDSRISPRAEATRQGQGVQSTETATNAPQRSEQARSHRELMLLSTTLSREQTASHVANAAARNVQAILEGALWVRDVSLSKRLKFEQILKVS